MCDGQLRFEVSNFGLPFLSLVSGISSQVMISPAPPMQARPRKATLLALAALALFGPKLYQLAMRPKPDHVPGDA